MKKRKDQRTNAQIVVKADHEGGLADYFLNYASPDVAADPKVRRAAKKFVAAYEELFKLLPSVEEADEILAAEEARNAEGD